MVPFSVSWFSYPLSLFFRFLKRPLFILKLIAVLHVCTVEMSFCTFAKLPETEACSCLLDWEYRDKGVLSLMLQFSLCLVGFVPES